MAYASSPLWLLFLLFSPVLFIGGRVPVQNTFLFFCAMFLLLMPKVLAAHQLIASPERRRSAGGCVKIMLSTAGETVYSMILAPILMLFYTQFVWSSFFGGPVGWGRQKRTDHAGPTWRECTVVHLTHTIVAIAAAALVAWLLPAMLPWLLLVLIGPIVSIPFSRLVASNRLGLLSQRQGWFLIPEETRPPWELLQLENPFESSAVTAAHNRQQPEDFGLGQTVLDPRLNAIHVSLLHERQQVSVRTRQHLIALCEQLLCNGPSALSVRDKRILLWDADSMLKLHRKLWGSTAADCHPWWQAAFRDYLESLADKENAAVAH
jgi:membrane glycosyltransferase